MRLTVLGSRAQVFRVKNEGAEFEGVVFGLRVRWILLVRGDTKNPPCFG